MDNQQQLITELRAENVKLRSALQVAIDHINKHDESPAGIVVLSNLLAALTEEEKK